jgi:hypothetical protein
MLAPHPTPKLEDHPLPAVCDCLFNIFTATLHIGGRSSICNLRMHHAVVTGAHLSWSKLCLTEKNNKTYLLASKYKGENNFKGLGKIKRQRKGKIQINGSPLNFNSFVHH